MIFILRLKNKKPRIRIRTQDARYHPTLHRLTCCAAAHSFLSGNGGYRRKLSPDGVHFPRSRATSAAVCRRLAPSVCSLKAHAAYCSRSKRLNLQSHYNISGMICQGFSATFFGRGGRCGLSLSPRLTYCAQQLKVTARKGIYDHQTHDAEGPGDHYGNGRPFMFFQHP